MKDISYRVALGGIVSALCLVTMFLAGILPALYLLLPMTAGVLIMIMAFEVSTGWAFLTYLSVSLLSLFVTFDKEAALVFIMLFGHYPILRIYIQKIKIKGLRFLIKFAVLNLCAISYFYMTIVLFGLEQVMEEFGDFGKYSNYLLLGLANFLFLLYDFSLDTMYIFYRKRLMPKFKRKR